jgi:glycosyltransferase involved in cell wall biosynthesis
MSVGRPVVATDVGSIHEAVIDGETGFLLRPGDAAGLVERVTRLLRDQALRRSMGAAARRAVIEHWSLDAMVRGYERLIQSVYDRKVVGLSGGNCGEAAGALIMNRG